MAFKIVSLDGNTGSGKSTVLSELEAMGYLVFPEDLDKWGSMLNMFYSDPKRWTFTFQMTVINSHCHRREVINTSCRNYENEFVFIERCPQACRVFSTTCREMGFKNDEEHSLYEELMNRLAWDPEYKYYIETDVNVCMDRITKRGRECESGIDCSYLETVASKYGNIDFDMRFNGLDDPHRIACDILASLKN